MTRVALACLRSPARLRIVLFLSRAAGRLSGEKKTLYSTLRLPEFRFTYVQQGVQQNAQSDHALMHVPQSQSG